MFGKIKHSYEYETFENKSIGKKPNIKQMNRVKHIRIKLWKYKLVDCLEI